MTLPSRTNFLLKKARRYVAECLESYPEAKQLLAEIDEVLDG